MASPAATLTRAVKPAPSTAEPTATLVPPTRMPEGWEQARVVRIVDGDTIRVELGGRQETVRYIGVDAPETNHPTIGSQPYGPEATEANRLLVEGKVVALERDRSETDRYGRLLRYVWVGDVLVNAELVRQGYARSVSYPPDTKYQGWFDALEQEAREAGRGMWAALSPVLPSGDVRITAKQKATEPELVTLTNEGLEPVDLTGWWLLSVRGSQRFDLPPGLVLEPGASVTIYSGPGAAEAGGLFWTEAHVWNQSQSDPAELYNAAGELVDRW